MDIFLWGSLRSLQKEGFARDSRCEPHLKLVQVGVLLVPRLLEPDEVRGALVELYQQHLVGQRTHELQPLLPFKGPPN